MMKKSHLLIAILAALFMSTGCSSGSEQTESDEAVTEQPAAEEDAEETGWQDDVDKFKASTRSALDEVKKEMDRLAGEIQKSANEANQRSEAEMRAELEELEDRLDDLDTQSKEAFNNARAEISAEIEDLRAEIKKAANTEP